MRYLLGALDGASRKGTRLVGRRRSRRVLFCGPRGSVSPFATSTWCHVSPTRAPLLTPLLEEIQSTWWLIPGSAVSMCKKIREICHRHSRRQTVANRGWSAQRWLHRRGRRQCESFLVRLSRCAGTIPSLTARRVTGEIEKLTPSSRRAEGASLLEHLRSRSSAAPTPCDRADPLGSTDDEVRMSAQPPLVVFVSVYGCFSCD